VKINDRNFAENDKVIFLENNKKFDVKNGQIGVVKSFLNGILSVESEGATKNINTLEYEKINHAYAITLHCNYVARISSDVGEQKARCGAKRSNIETC